MMSIRFRSPEERVFYRWIKSKLEVEKIIYRPTGSPDFTVYRKDLDRTVNYEVKTVRWVVAKEYGYVYMSSSQLTKLKKSEAIVVFIEKGGRDILGMVDSSKIEIGSIVTVSGAKIEIRGRSDGNTTSTSNDAQPYYKTMVYLPKTMIDDIRRVKEKKEFYSMQDCIRYLLYIGLIHEKMTEIVEKLEDRNIYRLCEQLYKFQQITEFLTKSVVDLTRKLREIEEKQLK